MLHSTASNRGETHIASKIVAKVFVTKSSFDGNNSGRIGRGTVGCLAGTRVGTVTGKRSFRPMSKGNRGSRGRFMHVSGSNGTCCTIFGCVSRRLGVAATLRHLKLSSSGRCELGRL